MVVAHLLTCETRDEQLVAYKQSLAPLAAHPPADVVVSNLCSGRPWHGFTTKVEAVLNYSRSPAVAQPFVA